MAYSPSGAVDVLQAGRQWVCGLVEAAAFVAPEELAPP